MYRASAHRRRKNFVGKENNIIVSSITGHDARRVHVRLVCTWPYSLSSTVEKKKFLFVDFRSFFGRPVVFVLTWSQFFFTTFIDRIIVYLIVLRYSLDRKNESIGRFWTWLWSVSNKSNLLYPTFVMTNWPSRGHVNFLVGFVVPMK